MESSTILYIDDELIVRQSLSKYLEQRGFLVLQAENGEAGLEIFGNERPTVVLVDLKMPGIDGLEFIRRAKENHPDTEFAIVTGYASLESAVDAINLGVSAYLHKPLSSADELISMVKRVLKVEQT